MATHAGLALGNHRRIPPAGDGEGWCRAVDQRWLNRAVRRVAAVAQERRTRLQQALSGCAMRVVAGGAVFGNRLVVVHEGAALFHVTGKAGIGNAVALHQLGAGGAM